VVVNSTAGELLVDEATEPIGYENEGSPERDRLLGGRRDYRRNVAGHHIDYPRHQSDLGYRRRPVDVIAKRPHHISSVT
jgi:hypothetical protein